MFRKGSLGGKERPKSVDLTNRKTPAVETASPRKARSLSRSHSGNDVLADVVGEVGPAGEYEAEKLVNGSAVRIRDVLRAKKENFSSLVAYAKQSFNEDMVMFWALSDSYGTKLESDDSERRRMAEHITKCYLRVGAEREINISARMRLKIIKLLDADPPQPLPLELFVESQQEVELLMDKNLGGFLDGKRSFWKQKVAWDTKEGASPSAGGSTNAVSPQSRDGNANKEVRPSGSSISTESLLKFASGGDLALEAKLKQTGETVGSVDDIVKAILN